MRELLDEIRVGGTPGSPQFYLSQCRLGGPLPLLIFPFDGLDDSVGPRLHSQGVVVHEFLVLDIPLDIVADGHNGELDGDCAGDLHGSMADMRDELLQVLARLCVLALERQVDLPEEETEHVELVLHAAHHQVTDAMLQIHSVTYLIQKIIKNKS